jgi:hypothetical protein
MSPEIREKLLNLPGYVVLGKREGGNAYNAIIERSFSMDVSSDNANFWWIGEARDNFFGAKWELSKEIVLKNAERHRDAFNKTRPDMKFEVFDVRDPDLPIVIDWDTWLWAHESSDKTLSGVRDKFIARNPPFKMKDEYQSNSSSLSSSDAASSRHSKQTVT